MPSANFERAMKFTLEREGRAYVNNPADKGGPTRYGITQRTLAAYKGTDVTEDDVKYLKEADAIRIYAQLYWNPAQLERVQDSNLSLILFDFGLNAGINTSIKTLQRVLNQNFSENIIVDGILGNETAVAIRTAPEWKLNFKMIKAIQTHYVRICILNPTQLVFLEGWLNRSFELWEAVA